MFQIGRQDTCALIPASCLTCCVTLSSVTGTRWCYRTFSQLLLLEQFCSLWTADLPMVRANPLPFWFCNSALSCSPISLLSFLLSPPPLSLPLSFTGSYFPSVLYKLVPKPLPLFLSNLSLGELIHSGNFLGLWHWEHLDLFSGLQIPTSIHGTCINWQLLCASWHVKCNIEFRETNLDFLQIAF